MAALTTQVNLEAALDPAAFARLRPFLAVDIMEEACKASMREVAKACRRSRAWTDRYRTLRTSFRVQGSRFLKHRPSARLRGAPHLQLVERGHRAFGPARGRAEPAFAHQLVRFGGRSRYVDSGKFVRGRPIVSPAILSTIAEQHRALRKRLDLGLARVNSELSRGSYSRKSLRALNRDRRRRRSQAGDAAFDRDSI